MEQVLFVAFLAAWCGFWGWMLVHRPETVFKVNTMSQDNLRFYGGAAAKGGLVGVKLLGKVVK